MIQSMTGYYKTDVEINDKSCNMEIRSVNHRYLEVKLRIPKQFRSLEDKLTAIVKKLLTRGKVDISINLEKSSIPLEKMELNLPLWEKINDIIQILDKDYQKKVNINLSDLMNAKDLLTYQQTDTDSEIFEQLFRKTIKTGIKGLIEMRKTEGKLLLIEIEQHLEKMKELIDQVPKFRQEILTIYQNKLKKNLKQLSLDYQENDPRILQEIGIFMDRIDISEELERFNTHLIHFKELLDSPDPVGRKLDFLLQEFNREANTLCSKANHTNIAKIGVELKSEIEKVREQIQNIE
ncbi:MAG: YicC family protein [Deltaproteobacteria bacterium]|jgi:uncharacterized protein (TIGR00255 family)|nr:YicC family protein [Deltaproteobacteria bacterium]MBT4527857.1 YicC family protein [Deltaproteobacteria bacterium]